MVDIAVLMTTVTGMAIAMTIRGMAMVMKGMGMGMETAVMITSTRADPNS